MELHQNRQHDRKYVQFENKYPKCEVSPPSYESGAQKPCLSTTSQLNGNFNGLYFRNETYTQLDKCVGS